MESLIREKRHQQRHGVGGPLRLPPSFAQTRGRVPGQLQGFKGLPAGGRHGDGGRHGEPYQGESHDQSPPHEARFEAEPR